MSVHVLHCPNCGADLDVADGAETIRCEFCGARCRIEGQGAAMRLSLIAQQLERIEGHAAQTAAGIEALRQQQTHGLASQVHTNEAVRRAAMAQEAAAYETAHAARLQANQHYALLAAEQQRSTAQAFEYRRVLGLRSKYRWMLALSCLALSGSILLAALTAALHKTGGALGEAVGLLFATSPVWLTFYFLSRHYSSKFNRAAFFWGLPPVNLRSTGCAGLLGILAISGVIVAVIASAASKPDKGPMHDATPPPADVPDLAQPSNETSEEGSRPAGAETPSNEASYIPQLLDKLIDPPSEPETPSNEAPSNEAPNERANPPDAPSDNAPPTNAE